MTKKAKPEGQMAREAEAIRQALKADREANPPYGSPAWLRRQPTGNRERDE